MRGCAVPTELPNECGARQIKLATSRARGAGNVAACARPQRRARADRPSLRSRDNWHAGDAVLRQGAWAQGAIGERKTGDTGTYPSDEVARMAHTSAVKAVATT